MTVTDSAGTLMNFTVSLSLIHILRCKVPEQPIVVESGRIGRVVTYGMGVQSARTAFVDTVEGTSANEEDVRRIDLYEFLVGVFASSLRRNVHDRAFEYLQQ